MSRSRGQTFEGHDACVQQRPNLQAIFPHDGYDLLQFDQYPLQYRAAVSVADSRSAGITRAGGRSVRKNLSLALLQSMAGAVGLGANINNISAVSDASINFLHSRALGITEVHSEESRLMVTITAGFSAGSA
jgi:hypothetical protein